MLGINEKIESSAVCPHRKQMKTFQNRANLLIFRIFPKRCLAVAIPFFGFFAEAPEVGLISANFLAKIDVLVAISIEDDVEGTTGRAGEGTSADFFSFNEGTTFKFRLLLACQSKRRYLVQ